MTHEAKKALAGQLPSVGRSMCVEISLKTSEVNVSVDEYDSTLGKNSKVDFSAILNMLEQA